MKTSRKIILSLLSLLALAFIAGIFNIEPLLGIGGITMAIAPIVAGIKTSQQLMDEKRDIWDKAQAIVAKVKEEKRDRTPEETTDYDGYLARMKELDKEIQRAKDHENFVAQMAGVHHSKQEQDKKEAREAAEGFNLLKAIRSQLPNQKLEGKELEMHQEAVRESRALGVQIEGVGIPSIIMLGEKRAHTATGGSSGSEGGVLVPTLIQGFIEPLKAKMVLAQLGAQFLTGLSGNIDIPVGAATTVAWEGEIDANAETSMAFTKKTLSPNRLGAYADFSKQLLFQGGAAAQNYVQNDILARIALAVELAAINGTSPEGILQTSGIGAVVGGTNGAAPTWGNIIDLEREIAIDNADYGSLGYLTNPKVKAKLKQTALDAGSGLYVWPQSENGLNGYKALTTTQVPSTLDKGTATGVCSAIIFGNFADLMIAQWGGMDIVVDPYTQATNSMVRLVVNSWWDVLVKRAESFAAMKDALTT